MAVFDGENSVEDLAMANQGRGSAGNFANDRKRAAEAGRKGGMASRGGGGKENNPANFANDRRKASEAGRKGGLASHGKRMAAREDGGGTGQT